MCVHVHLFGLRTQDCIVAKDATLKRGCTGVAIDESDYYEYCQFKPIIAKNYLSHAGTAGESTTYLTGR